ncbi:MAG TPA: glucokinase [Trichocoleus sp.]|jgi:glucokinase
MTQLLAGDTGGTKTILRLVEAQQTESGSGLSLKTLYESRYISAEFPDLAPIARKFLAAAAAETGIAVAPEAACFSIAGPVVNNTCVLTNLSWTLDAKRLERDLSLAHVSLINDFVAVGRGIEGLQPEDLITLQAGEPQADAPIAVIGAGTGLGQGFLLRQGDRYQVFPTEGGHSDFAPRSELEFHLLKYLRDKHGLSRISVERVVSGMGIVAIYQFLRDRQTYPESPEIAQAIRTWEQEAGRSKSVDPGAVIAQAAAAGKDTLCQETMQLFVEAYGAEAGNLALKLLPFGGLYVAGGVAAKNVPLLQSGAFLQAMRDKGRMRPLMERVPVHIVVNQRIGLIGAALTAGRL